MGNSSSTLTLSEDTEWIDNGGNTTPASMNYVIGKIRNYMGCTGSGRTDPFDGPRTSQNLYASAEGNWRYDPSYVWNNTFNTLDTHRIPYLRMGDHYAPAGVVKPNYSTYPYPHPLRGSEMTELPPEAPSSLAVSDGGE